LVPPLVADKAGDDFAVGGAELSGWDDPSYKS
jgi:hypothetical protein